MLNSSSNNSQNNNTTISSFFDFLNSKDLTNECAEEYKYIIDPNRKKSDIEKYVTEYNSLLPEISSYLVHHSDATNRKNILDINKNNNPGKRLVETLNLLMDNLYEKEKSSDAISFAEKVMKYLNENKQERLVTEHPTDSYKLSFINLRNAGFYIELIRDNLNENNVNASREAVLHNIKIISDILNSDKSLYRDKEIISQDLKFLKQIAKYLCNTYDLPILQDIINNIIARLEKIKVNLITVEHTKRSPEMEHRRMLQFLADETINSMELYEIINGTITSYIKAKFTITNDDLYEIEKIIAFTMIVKTGTWAGDSAGKPRVTSVEIEKSYKENLDFICDMALNLLQGDIQEPTHKPYISIKHIIDVYKVEVDKEDKDKLKELERYLRDVINKIEFIKSSNLNEGIIPIEKHKIINLLKKISDDKNCSALFIKYPNIRQSFNKFYFWAANNFHVNIYERTDAIVNQTALNHILKLVLENSIIEHSYIFETLRYKDYIDLTEEEKLKFHNELQDIDSERAQVVLRIIRDKIAIIYDKLPEIAKKELDRNRLINKGTYLIGIREFGNKYYPLYDNYFKSMIADTENASDVMAKLLLLRLTSEDISIHPAVPLIPLLEKVSIFKTAKKIPKKGQKSSEAIYYNLFTSKPFMQYLVQQGLGIKLMTARSDTTYRGGKIADQQIEYSMFKLKDKFPKNPKILSTIEKAYNSIEIKGEQLKQLLKSNSITTFKIHELDKNLKLKIYDGKGHNPDRNSGDNNIYTVQGAAHTIFNVLPLYLLNYENILYANIERSFSLDKVQNLIYNEKAIFNEVTRILNKITITADKINNFRFSLGKTIGTRWGYNSILLEAFLNNPFLSKHQKAMNKSARGEKDQEGFADLSHPVFISKNEVREFIDKMYEVEIVTTQQNTRAISAAQKAEFYGLQFNKTGPYFMGAIREVLKCRIKDADPMMIKQMFLLYKEAFRSLVIIAYGYARLDIEGYNQFYPKKMLEEARKQKYNENEFFQDLSQGDEIIFNPESRVFRIYYSNGEVRDIKIKLTDTIPMILYLQRQMIDDYDDLMHILKIVFDDKEFDPKNPLFFLDKDSQEYINEQMIIERTSRRILATLHRKYLSGLSDEDIFGKDFISDNHDKDIDKLTETISNIYLALMNSLNLPPALMPANLGHLHVYRKERAESFLRDFICILDNDREKNLSKQDAYIY